MPRSATLLSALALLAAGVCSSAWARSATYVTRHWETTAGATSVELGGQTFVNHGLVGVGRLSATTRDFNNETLGSFSSMALTAWRRLPDGTYAGDLFTLPDRGPNNLDGVKGTTNYANRLHALHLTLRPYTGGQVVPADDTGLKIVPTGGFLLRDRTGRPFTGKDPGANILVRDSLRYPSPQAGEGAGAISLDSEGLTLLADGSFYVCDEYAAGIYLFDATGRQLGAIQAVPALLPMTAGQLNFNGEKAPDTGRRNNQGLEAISVSPDGTRLFAILQSATVQDTAGKDAATRNNTRVLVYDISETRTPKAPIGHYVLQLPTVREDGDDQPADKTAAQSEMVALNDSQFLVLARDGNGRGVGKTQAPVFKSVLLADIAGASNLAGTAYEQGVTPVADHGALVAGITPVRQVELVNLLNPTQLARFGVNLSTAPSNSHSLPEKLEAMALAPVGDGKAPHDVFLLVGDDNDFQTAKGHIDGRDFDAGLTDPASGTGDNDNLILVYRLTLPTYAPAKLPAPR